MPYLRPEELSVEARSRLAPDLEEISAKYPGQGIVVETGEDGSVVRAFVVPRGVKASAKQVGRTFTESLGPTAAGEFLSGAFKSLPMKIVGGLGGFVGGQVAQDATGVLPEDLQFRSLVESADKPYATTTGYFAPALAGSLSGEGLKLLGKKAAGKLALGAAGGPAGEAVATASTVADIGLLLKAALGAARKQATRRLGQAALGGGLDVGAQAISGEPIDWERAKATALLSAALGEPMSRSVNRRLMGAGERVGNVARRAVRPAIDTVEGLPFIGPPLGRLERRLRGLKGAEAVGAGEGAGRVAGTDPALEELRLIAETEKKVKGRVREFFDKTPEPSEAEFKVFKQTLSEEFPAMADWVSSRTVKNIRTLWTGPTKTAFRAYQKRRVPLRKYYERADKILSEGGDTEWEARQKKTAPEIKAVYTMRKDGVDSDVIEKFIDTYSRLKKEPGAKFAERVAKTAAKDQTKLRETIGQADPEDFEFKPRMAEAEAEAKANEEAVPGVEAEAPATPVKAKKSPKAKTGGRTYKAPEVSPGAEAVDAGAVLESTVKKTRAARKQAPRSPKAKVEQEAKGGVLTAEDKAEVQRQFDHELGVDTAEKVAAEPVKQAEAPIEAPIQKGSKSFYVSTAGELSPDFITKARKEGMGIVVQQEPSPQSWIGDAGVKTLNDIKGPAYIDPDNRQVVQLFYEGDLESESGPSISAFGRGFKANGELKKTRAKVGHAIEILDQSFITDLRARDVDIAGTRAEIMPAVAQVEEVAKAPKPAKRPSKTGTKVRVRKKAVVKKRTKPEAKQEVKPESKSDTFVQPKDFFEEKALLSAKAKDIGGVRRLSNEERARLKELSKLISSVVDVKQMPKPKRVLVSPQVAEKVTGRVEPEPSLKKVQRKVPSKISSKAPTKSEPLDFKKELIAKGEDVEGIMDSVISQIEDIVRRQVPRSPGGLVSQVADLDAMLSLFENPPEAAVQRLTMMADKLSSVGPKKLRAIFEKQGVPKERQDVIMELVDPLAGEGTKSPGGVEELLKLLESG